jgi:hypothetical protein
MIWLFDNSGPNNESKLKVIRQSEHNTRQYQTRRRDQIEDRDGANLLWELDTAGLDFASILKKGSGYL